MGKKSYTEFLYREVPQFEAIGTQYMKEYFR